jgi:hypothetical protein
VGSLARGSPSPTAGSEEEEEEAARPADMCDLVARTGRHLQRYEDGRRLVAGCVRRGRPPPPPTTHSPPPSLPSRIPTTKEVNHFSAFDSI